MARLVFYYDHAQQTLNAMTSTTAYANWVCEINQTASANTWINWATTSASTASLVYATSENNLLWFAGHAHSDGIIAQAPARSPALIAEHRRLQAESDARISAECATLNAIRAEAIARAELLLIGALTEAQRAEYKRERRFVVQGRSGKRYRVNYGRMGNVDVINSEGRISHRLCAHPALEVPDPDTMLAQKMMLETDDEGFARIANRRPYNGPAVAVLPALQ